MGYKKTGGWVTSFLCESGSFTACYYIHWMPWPVSMETRHAFGYEWLHVDIGIPHYRISAVLLSESWVKIHRMFMKKV